METKIALKKIDAEIKFLKEKKQYIKWISKVYKHHKKLVNKPIHLVFFDNDEFYQSIFDNLPTYTKTITFLNYHKYNKLRMDNLPVLIEKIFIVDTEMNIDDITNNIKSPFGCEVKILDNINNAGFYDNNLYDFYLKTVNIRPETELYTIKRVLDKPTIINIEVEKIKKYKLVKQIQATSIQYCDCYNFIRDNENVFDNITF